MGTGRGEVLILAGIDLLALDRLHEALGHGIVIGAACPAHARLDAGGLQPGDIITVRILRAAIGVVDQASQDCQDFRVWAGLMGK